MRAYPFSSIVGQEQAKLALQLVAVDPSIGGVLLRGEKGSAKTTLARGLAELLGGAPFVELPLGATEDRLLGSIDVAAALAGGEVSFRPGLLADAHGGVLYVDEVNLLADHLTDVLLDVAASGVNRVERDGIAHRHDARFVLIGSMNPEEGELRPQLADRFGLCVEVRAPTDPAARVEIVRRRLAFDRGDGCEPGGTELAGESFGAAMGVAGNRELADRLAQARSAELSDELLAQASAVALSAGVEGLRADLVLCRAAAAHAALDGRAAASTDDLRAVAPLALAHRGRRSPADPSVMGGERLQQAVDEVLGAPGDGAPPGHAEIGEPASSPGMSDGPPEADRDGSAPQPMPQGRRLAVSPPSGRGHAESERGRVVRDVPAGEHPDRPVSVTATVRRAVADGQLGTGPAAPQTVRPEDHRVVMRSRPKGSLVVIAVDTSGSMGAALRAQAATGAVLGLLADAYVRRDQVSLITFGDGGSQVVLPPTGSIEVARRRLGSLQTGGRTPLGAGLRQALAIATSDAPGRDNLREPLIVLLSDGRATEATGNGDPFAEALEAAAAIAAKGVSAIVVDCETGGVRLGLAREVAHAMGARYVSGLELTPEALDETIRSGSTEDR